MLNPQALQLRVGVDVGSQYHRVAVGLSDGSLLEEFEIPHTAAGFQDFFSRIEGHAKRHPYYEVLRMSEAPEEIHVEFVDRGTRPTGIGEIGNPFMSAAVANAFHARTGKRLYHMPFTPDRVLEALEA